MQNSFLKSLCLENITQRWFLNPKIRGRRGHWKCLIKKSFREFKVIFSQIYLLKWLHLDSNPQTVRERTLSNLAKLAKWLNCLASTYLCDAFDCMLLSCHVRVSEWIRTLWICSETCARHDKNVQSVYRLKLKFFGGSLENYFHLFPVHYEKFLILWSPLFTI